MADDRDREKKSRGSGWGDLILFLVGLLILVAFWFVSGAYKAHTLTGLLVPSPFATSTGQGSGFPAIPYGDRATSGSGSISSSTIGGGVAEVSKSPWSPNNSDQLSSLQGTPQLPGYQQSPFVGQVTVENIGGARTSNPSQEYIELIASGANHGPVNISGWQLKSTISGRTAVIGGGAQTPLLSQINYESPIPLQPGQTALVLTGQSPVGISFEENECTGYFQQFQQFTPALSMSCPLPQNELSFSSDPRLAQDGSCAAALSQLAPCQVLLQPPIAVSPQCSDFMTSRFTYNSCVAAHRNDPNFESPQWRIFLGQGRELWNNQNDIVALLDSQGKVVSAMSY